MKTSSILLALVLGVSAGAAIAKPTKEERKAAWIECGEEAKEQGIAKEDKLDWLKACVKEKLANL
ncbi:hypothetical protein C2869_21355 [Saccharobesus litoralis]|uniref:Uncharacterized protein n=1 Tax=Saccharobesus litoralis TaxID=2172099 RepID=A0A2S0VX64_9ALTE|nr:hypothetical protein [Saccharobesus litoralis]AWB68788.1 hypothetical protein C2869_21355 [Saccharobesus litoralis]